MKPKHILITGANGFIGSSLSAYLNTQGFNVTGVTINDSFSPHYKIIKSNFSSKELADIINKVKPFAIIHAAGSASVSASLENPYNDYKNSVLPFVALLEATRVSKLHPRIYFLSSAAVYGNPTQFPITEESPIAPISPYGYHKLLCEHEAKLYSDYFSIPITILRLFSLFGPLQKKLLIWEIYSQIKKSKQIIIEGTGNEKRDYVFIEDLNSIITLLLNSSKQVKYQVINIASGRSFKVCEIVNMINNMFNNENPVIYKGKKRSGNPNIWITDNTLMKRLIDKDYKFDINKRLEETINIWGKSES